MRVNLPSNFIKPQNTVICVKQKLTLLLDRDIDPSSLYNWLTNKVKVMANKVNVQPYCALKRFNASTKICESAAESFT